MLDWYNVLLISGILSGVSQVIGKGLVGKRGAVQVGFWREVGTTIAYFIYVAIYGVSGWGLSLLMPLIVYGIVLSVSVAAWYSASREDLSGTSVFSSSVGQLLIIIFSMFLFREWVYFDPGNIRGLLNILSAVLGIGALIMYQGGLRFDRVRWSKMLALSVVVNVFGNIYFKQIIDQGFDPAVSQIYSNIGIFLGTAVLMKVRGQKYMIGRNNIVRAVFQGLVAGTSVMMYLVILENNPLSLASMIRRIATMLVVVSAGLFFYKEKKSLRKVETWSLVMGILVYIVISMVNK